MAGNGPHGLLFQKLWAMLLLSFYPPSKAVTCSTIVLTVPNEIFSMFTYILQNVNPDGTNLLSYEVGYDEEEDTDDVDAGAEINEAMRQQEVKKVSCPCADFHLHSSLRRFCILPWTIMKGYYCFDKFSRMCLSETCWTS